MSKNRRQEQNFHPISQLASIGELVDGRVQDLEEMRETLTQAKREPSGLDDATVDRVHRVHIESLELASSFEIQLARWLTEDVTAGQRAEVERLQRQMVRYREDCQWIIQVTEELKKSTIDAILRMSDEEVGRAVLLGEMPAAKSKERLLPFTAEQLHLAAQIDAKIRDLVRSGVSDDLSMIAAMADFMPVFKRIMDTSTQEMMDELTARYPGLYLYAKTLERLAQHMQARTSN